MKSLLTAFALLSFVAASTVPMITQAQAAQSESKKHKVSHHKTKKPTRHVAHKKTGGHKMKKPSQA